jgi:ferredoxin
VFDVDDEGYVLLKMDAPPPPLEHKVRDAVANCPEGAIAVN